MSNATHKPVIFLAFANDRDETVGYLRNLPDEARRLRDVLQPAEQAGLCEVVVRTNSTGGDIFKVCQDPKYRNRIAILHYGGHANGYQLLLESAAGQSAAADAGGLAAFLAQQQGLHLVFLNGCSTQQQTQGLLDANISTVISTSRSIDDRVATDFAHQFYQGLAGGATIRTAYREAEAAVQTAAGGNTRGLYFSAPDEPQSRPEADRWPWSLYLREGSENADQWNLPEAVNDPLFGLPLLPEQDLPESPYRQLNWFRRQDAEVFFGRGHQIRELYDRLTAPRTAPIMLFYGQSGVGKSSVLDAGLIPRLERDHEVRYLRRTEGGLLDTLQSAFLPEASGVALETAWRVTEEQTGKPLIVFLDQVEELYTRPIPAVPDELDQLLKAVQATFVKSDRRPRGKLVLGFRKEWLAELESHLVDYELPRTKVFLEPLDRRGILEVVQGPARSQRLRERYGLTVEDGLAEIIAEDLLADRDSAIAPTLQILLTKIWARAAEANYAHPQFSRELYQQLKRDGILLRDFLNQQIAAFRERFPEAVDSGLLLDVVALHTTPLGTANQCTVEQLQQQYAHLSATMPDLLQQCQDLHLLTIAGGAQRESTKATRLAHDTLAPLVREQFDGSDKPGQRARRILDNRSVDWEADESGPPLDEADLAVVEQGLSGTHALRASERRLLEGSRKLRAKLNRTRKFLKIAVATAVAVITITAGIAIWQRGRAVAQRKVADARFDLANQAVSDMLTEVGSETLKNVPQMEGVRAALLRKALLLYEDIGETSDAHDPASRFETAMANFYVGDIQRLLGTGTGPQKSEAAYKTAKSQLGELSHEFPSNSKYKQAFAGSHMWLGELLRKFAGENRTDEAEQNYDEAINIQQELASQTTEGNGLQYQIDLGRSHMNRGIVRKNTGQLAVAKKDYDRAEHLFSEVLLDEALRPEQREECRVLLAKCHLNRGVLLRQLYITDPNQQVLESVKTAYNKAIDELHTVQEENRRRGQPPRLEYSLDLAKYRNNLAIAWLTGVEQLNEAEGQIAKAVQLCETLNVGPREVRVELAKFYNTQAFILSRKQPHLAVPVWEKAANVLETVVEQNERDAAATETLAMIRCNICDQYRKQGEHGKAIDAIKQLEDLCCTKARYEKAAKLMQQGREMVQIEDPVLADEYLKWNNLFLHKVQTAE